MKKILIGCEKSQAVCLEFRKRGFEAYSCDIQPCSGGHPEWHLQMDIFKAINGGSSTILPGNVLKAQDGSEVYIGNGWDAAIFFPDCTYLTVTGNKWLKDQPERKSGALVGQARRQARADAYEFFMALWNCGIPKIAMENPIGVMSTLWRKPDQIITPMMFGHVEPKKTCLWLKGFPKLKHTHTGIEPEYHTTQSGKRMPKWYAYADKSKGQKERANIRSKTFSGIAEAMGDQWGKYLLEQNQ